MRMHPDNRRAASAAQPFVTKDLSSRTWPDFETLFAKYRGVQAGCWCMFYHRAHPLSREGVSREGWAAKNRSDQEALVHRGRSHGILVYAEEEAVGWCQYGRREELPRIESGRIYRKLALPAHGEELWRITCFFVDRDFRGAGVARVALRAALDSIRKKGGGIVEAYPATHPKAVAIWFGTVGMFEKEGFRKVAGLGRSNVVMRRRIRSQNRSPVRGSRGVGTVR